MAIDTDWNVEFKSSYQFRRFLTVWRRGGWHQRKEVTHYFGTPEQYLELFKCSNPSIALDQYNAEVTSRAGTFTWNYGESLPADLLVAVTEFCEKEFGCVNG